MKDSKKVIIRIIKIISIILVIIVINILYISYTVDNNKESLNQTAKEIAANYQTDKINYINTYGNYYIIETKNQVIVLSKDYKEVLKKDLQDLKELDSKTDIIYKKNKLIYEKKIIKDKKVTYQYYDAITGKEINSTTLELR